MRDNDTNVESDSLLKKYARRPKMLEGLCLAELISFYNLTFKSQNTPDEQENNTDEEDNTVTYNKSDMDECFYVGNLKYQKRKKPKVIRFVNIKKEVDSENHFRELILLFYPWRKEQDLIANFSSFEEKYIYYKDEIFEKQNIFSLIPKNDLDAAISDYQSSTSTLSGHETHVKAYSAPNAEHTNEQDIAQRIQQSQKFSSLLPTKPSHARYDLGQDIGVSLNSDTSEFWVPHCIPDNQYYPLIQTLNLKQKSIFYHILHSFKMNKLPLHLFITGGAGVGKSQLLKAVHQSLLRILSHNLQESPDDIKVLLTAPTGKAAFLIKGTTIHSALQIPINQGYQYKPLSAEKLNTARTKYKSLKLMVIDEVSMVGNSVLNFVNRRLQEVMNSQNLSAT